MLGVDRIYSGKSEVGANTSSWEEKERALSFVDAQREETAVSGASHMQVTSQLNTELGAEGWSRRDVRTHGFASMGPGI